MRASKIFSLLLIATIAALSFVIVQSANAQNIPKPSVPEFTVKQIDYSYDIPVTITYSTDPFSGKQIAHESGGEHVSNKTIQVTVKNQPFQPQTLLDGNITGIRFTVQWKGHFGNWSDQSGISGEYYWIFPKEESYITTIALTENEYQEYTLVSGDQVDFRVQAQTGYFYTTYEEFDMHPYGIMGSRMEEVHEFVPFQLSDWSPTQTITIGSDVVVETSAEPSSTPTASPIPTQMPTTTAPSAITLGNFFGFDWTQTAIVVLAFFVVVLLAVTLVVLRANRKLQKQLIR